MVRKLKILFGAVLALTAFGVFVTSAHAEDEFHCSVEPCRLRLSTDGTGKTAHHVIVFENQSTTESLSYTCESLRGDAEAAKKTVTELTLTGLTYDNCPINGLPGTTVDMNGCDYRITGAGGRTDEAELHMECPTGKKIEITYNGCVLSISPYRANGIGYNTFGAPPNREITLTFNHLTIPAASISLTGTKAQCLINPSQAIVATYTTGNTLLTGERTTEEMAEAWYE